MAAAGAGADRPYPGDREPLRRIARRIGWAEQVGRRGHAGGAARANRHRPPRLKASIARVGGVDTRYFHEGTTGPRLLLVHGVGMSGAAWLRNVDALAQDFRVCAPDLLGNGLTGWNDPPPGPPHPHVLEHLAALVDHLEWDDFAV